MSDESPPPLPPQNVPPAPLPVPPAPEGYAWPPTATPLAYSLPAPADISRRPSVVTLVGVMSILVAVGSALSAAATALAAFLFLASGQATGRALAARAALMPPPAAPVPPARLPPEVGPDGIDAGPRRAFVDAFYSVRPVRPPRREQLDAILASHGRAIVLGAAARDAATQPSPDAVRSLVTDDGQLFSANPAAAPDFFRLTTGRLELYDDRAVFYPADGSATLRSAYGRPPTRRALTESEADVVVRQAKELAGGSMNDAQAASLATLLRAADQKLVAPPAAATGGASAAPGIGLVSVTPAAGGAVTVRSADAEVSFGPSGERLAAPLGAAPPPAPSTAAFLLIVAGCVANLILAVVLLVAALLLLRGGPRGRRLHLVWADLKVPVAVATACGFWWMIRGFSDALYRYAAAHPTGFAPRPRGLTADPWLALAAGAIALVYPLVVLLVMRHRDVRGYASAGP